MHLLAVQAGAVLDGEEAIDLGQSPGDIVILSSNDTDLACLSAAAGSLPEGFPSVRLANLLHLKHPMSVDLYAEQVVAHARIVVVRLLGGRGYWPYGLDEIRRVCRERNRPFIALLDDGAGEAESAELSAVPTDTRQRMARYLRAGGLANGRNALLYAADLIGHASDWSEPTPVLDAGLFWPGLAAPSLEDLKDRWIEGAPVAALVFYRALVMSGQTQAVVAMIDALKARGLNPLPVHVQSLKNDFAKGLLDDLFRRCPPQVVLNATAFATASLNAEAEWSGGAGGVLDRPGAPVLQLVFAATNHAAWADSARGLAARDLAMNVALPEVDGRLLAGAVAFKAEARFDPRTQCAIVGHDPAPEQIAHAADMAASWVRLRRTPPQQRRVAMILANYPNRDARIGNGVGLDTPQSAACVLKAMKAHGYDAAGAPDDGAALMARLLAGPTNAPEKPDAKGGQRLTLTQYQAFLDELAPSISAAIHERWGPPQDDPFFDEDGFRLPIHRFGHVAVGVQPARGYNIDPAGSYHDPALVPPHGYLAFYAWLRRDFGAHAMIHMGKHGNVEWLPGKALALSRDCFPQAIVGPTPQLYPFIVNDPGEGAQAKRRIGAAIIDHLTPPLTRAESYGALKALEVLVDEYYFAAGMDPRRLSSLRDDILTLAANEGLDVDCGLDLSDGEEALAALDNYLCDLKEMQIRDGLHVFSCSPQGRLRTDLLAALARTPRRLGKGRDGSLLRALANDLGLGFDPLDCRLGDPFAGPRPQALAEQGDAPWRTLGDTVERMEHLCAALIEGAPVDAEWAETALVMEAVRLDLAPRIDACGPAEMAALMAGLDGRFIAPGPSGAPTRGRPEVLPTGRNFYSVDTRAVPTPTAWKLGWASAQMLVEDHLQRTGDYPKAVALSAWGTSNMRTGGDDIAQALALMGARPTWELSTGRVTGFEILPLAVLGRPRVDVTVRISGFFRDAFMEQVDLLASAARAIQALDEDEADNPAAARFRQEQAELIDAGLAEAEATRQAGTRVYGSKPGAYGAGLQTMIDEKLWETRGDLAEAFIVWGAYAYGAGQEGAADRQGLEARLARVEAVIHNQDNREHDLLDSDDYYQFEGGMAAAVEAVRGTAPVSYHNDLSRPEKPVIRTLEDEIARTLRARLVNPKWISGVMRHGYKGAFEISAGVDYLFAFAAATDTVRNHHFDMVHRAFIEDEAVRDFMAEANPHALRDVAARLLEAVERGLWTPRSNSARTLLAELTGSPS